MSDKTEVAAPVEPKRPTPKVTLIDYTGALVDDPLYAARLLIYIKNTRLEMSAGAFRAVMNSMASEAVLAELPAIAITIRSSWEFVDYTFQIENVTRAFTHQLVRTRTASYAQQAQRVVDMSTFKHRLPDTVLKAGKVGLWDTTMGLIASTYKLLKDAGVPSQDCRGVLPTNVLTNIAMKTNLRTLADLVGKRENLRAQGEYEEVVRQMKAQILLVHPWADIFLNPERTRTPALDALLRAALGDRSPVDVPEINAALKELDQLKEIWG